jgi:hypothetical protein
LFWGGVLTLPFLSWNVRTLPKTHNAHL